MSIVTLLAISLMGCVSYPELITFYETEFPETTQDITNETEITLQPNDLLRVTVHSYNAEAAAPFNIETTGGATDRNNDNQAFRGAGGGQGTNTLELFMGYFVDETGSIDFPVIGPVELGGLTINEAKMKLVELIKPYLADAVVNMRLLNFKITVLGEVNRPGPIRLTNKRLTLLEAIGQAGDFSQYANRKNVLLIREKYGKRDYIRLDLQSNEIFTSPYFYLQQNDVLYIEPTKARVATVRDPAQRALSFGSAGVSLLTLIIALFSR